MTTKTKSTHALCASAIRRELKEAFPLIKFSVCSESYSGGNSVRVNWTDGVTTAQVDKIIDRYQYGHFNGMEDIYEYSNSIANLPQVKYTFSNRELSKEVRQKAFEHIKATYANCENITSENDYCEGCRSYVSNLVYRLLSDKDLSKGVKF